MNIRYVCLIFAAFFLSTGCERNEPFGIDCEEAARITQAALSIQELMSARELHGGFSDAKVFLVTAKSEAYVMRFSPSSHLDPRELACLKIASDSGYGPHLYAIAPDQRYVIMGYVIPHTITREDRSSKQYYQALGQVVSKMHHGPNFPEHEGIFTQIKHDLVKLKECFHLKNLTTRMETMLPVIQRGLASVSSEAPCHNDLNPNNTIFTGSSFKIIDYGTAGQDDPYFDVATVIQFNCLNSTKREEELMNAYLGRSMTSKERARLYLMKQAVRICYAARLILLGSSPEQSDEIDLGSETYEEFVMKSGSAGFDARRLAFHLFKMASTSFESAEFQRAISTTTTREASL
jgi:hypothetical protein